MKRSDLEYIQRALANLRPHMRTAPVMLHDEWRRIVTGLGEAFAGSPWAHLHDPAAWMNGTGADTPEPAPREGEPYEREGAWYNLTESEARDRGLIPDPAVNRWLVPRNLDGAGEVVRDEAAGTIVDALTGEWREMTPEERTQYPAPPPVDLSLYVDARTGDMRRDYCRRNDPTGTYVCTRPRGHDGLHAAGDRTGALLRSPWGAPVRPVQAPTVRECGDEYEDDDGDIHVCTEPRGHDEDTVHTDGDISW